MTEDELVWEHLTKILLLASEQSLVDTVEAIAAEAGVTQIAGFPVREFFDRLKRDKTERLIADFADTNPSVASAVKAALDSLDDERKDKPSQWKA